MGNNNLLSFKNISKSFPGVKALDKVSFDIKRGEIHGLVGENGAGKTTLMNIVAGIYRKDEGKTYFEEEEVEIRNYFHANTLGIRVVFQERSLVNNLSIAENIFGGSQPVRFFGHIDKRRLFRETKSLLDKLKIKEDPNRIVGYLQQSTKQMVEFAKALNTENLKLLILDEPTATVTEDEVDVIFKMLKTLVEQKKVTVIYISHRLAEIFKIATKVSVLRDGRYMGTKQVNETNEDNLVKLMVGRILEDVKAPELYEQKKVLEVKGLSSKKFEDISFSLKKGEILSFAGLAGAGRTEVMQAMFGIDRITEGEIFLNGKKVILKSPEIAIREGLGYLPEDRKEQALFLGMSISNNIAAASLNNFSGIFFMNDKKLKKSSIEFKDKLNIITPDIMRKALSLSGGNQQKAVIARWLLLNPTVLIVDEPTRGIDVGAKAEIYKILNEMVQKGTSIIVVSSDLPEVLTISNRIIVMWQGKITGELDVKEATEEKILHMASGYFQKNNELLNRRN
jgi:ABC-type sugar transport system ATPase subunit